MFRKVLTPAPAPSFLNNLEKIINAIEKLSKKENPDPIVFADLSGKFHSEICVSTGNELLAKIVDDIRLRLKIVRVTSFSSFNRRNEDFAEHRSVFLAIKEKNPSLAKELMLDHQTKVIEYVKRELIMQFYD